MKQIIFLPQFVILTNLLNIQVPSVQKEIMSTHSGICWYRKDNVDYVFVSVSGDKGESYVVQLKWVGKEATLLQLFHFKAIPPAKLSLPNELLIVNEKGQDYLYVILNGNNQLVKKELSTGNTVWEKIPELHLME